MLDALKKDPSFNTQYTGLGLGAAGGLALPFFALFKATLTPGADFIFKSIALEESIQKADLVITSEGKLDRQSLSGKAPVEVAKLAKRYHKPCLCLAGQNELESKRAKAVGLTDVRLLDKHMSDVNEATVKPHQNHPCLCSRKSPDQITINRVL